MDSDLITKINKLQALPNINGVYIIDSNGKIMENSSPNNEMLPKGA